MKRDYYRQRMLRRRLSRSRLAGHSECKYNSESLEHSSARPSKVACPFFMPIEKLENGAWPHPARLPLGCGWNGCCTAPGHDGEIPERKTLEQFCNLGYAGSCSRLPQERPWDAVRFAIMAQEDADRCRGPSLDVNNGIPSGIIRLRYVCERAHRPVEHGRLSFEAGGVGWLQRHPDARVQRMAECFLESCKAKRTLLASDGVAS